MGHPLTNVQKVTTRDSSARTDRVVLAVAHQRSTDTYVRILEHTVRQPTDSPTPKTMATMPARTASGESIPGVHNRGKIGVFLVAYGQCVGKRVLMRAFRHAR
jgi:hypothetical protein